MQIFDIFYNIQVDDGEYDVWPLNFRKYICESSNLIPHKDESGTLMFSINELVRPCYLINFNVSVIIFHPFATHKDKNSGIQSFIFINDLLRIMNSTYSDKVSAPFTGIKVCDIQSFHIQKRSSVKLKWNRSTFYHMSRWTHYIFSNVIRMANDMCVNININRRKGKWLKPFF